MPLAYGYSRKKTQTDSLFSLIQNILVQQFSRPVWAAFILGTLQLQLEWKTFSSGELAWLSHYADERQQSNVSNISRLKEEYSDH